MGQFFKELKRRNVLRVGAAYIVVAWLVIQVVETVFPAFGFGDSAVRVVVIVFAIGLIPALIFSWVFEFTPDGLKRDHDVDRSQSIAPNTSKKLDRAIVVILTLAVGYFAVDKFVLDPARDIEIEKRAAQRARSETLASSFGENSIAVLPFANMSDDASNEYFSDGISEELLNLLSKVQSLRVISRSSSFSYRGDDIHIPTVAEQLNVAYVLEGSVRKYGDQVRITAQLIEARSDTHLWSGTYDRTLDNVFAIQDEISAAIVDELRRELSLDIGTMPRDAVTANTEAHDAFLRGRYLVEQRTPNAANGAVREFEKAVTLDPDFALGHAELAIALLIAEPDEMTWDQLFARVEHHVEKAMVLNPGLAEAYAAKGRLLWNKAKLDEALLDEALTYYRRTIQINPSYADAYVVMAEIYWRQPSRYDEHFAALETALHLDPLSRHANRNYIFALIERNRLVEADQQIEKLGSFDPRGAIIFRGIRSSIGGEWANYILTYLEAAINGTGDLVFGEWFAWDLVNQLTAIGLGDEAILMTNGEDPEVLAWFGDPEEALALARAQLAVEPDSVWPAMMGFILAHAGHYAEARPYLEEAWQQQWGRRFVRADFYSSYLAEALVVVRRDAGDEVAANQVVVTLRDDARRIRDAGITLTELYKSIDYQEGVAAYLAGERDTALALISKAAKDGFWIPPLSAFQKSRYQDPDFAAILEKQAVRQARELGKVLAVVCGNNPYTSVWQPAEETCEQFAASGQD
jgi:adenylate cyclase